MRDKQSRGSIARPSMRACRMSLPRHFSSLHYFVAGLIVAEGSFGKKSHRNTGRFTFTNTNLEIIKLVYDFLIKNLEIPPEKISIYITYNLEISKFTSEHIKQHWKNLLKVSEDKIKIYPYRRKVKQNRKRTAHGRCQLRINDVEIKSKIETFINTIMNNINQVAGEGHIESP